MISVQQARGMAVPALEAIVPLLVVAIAAVFAGRSIDETDAAGSKLISWAIALGGAVALWAAGLLLRKTDRGLRVLLSLTCGIAVAGGVVLWLATNEPFPGNTGQPETAQGLLGLQAMVVSIGGLIAAFGIDYRRTDPWYVVAFVTALAAPLITVVLWVLGVRDATWF